MTIDPDERQSFISATVENYSAGVFGHQHATENLASCGLNATEIEDLLLPLRAVAFENFKNYKRLVK